MAVGSSPPPDLRSRSIRTLAWLGDAVFEQRVRWKIAETGDYGIDRLDAIKSEVVRAEAQAGLLDAILEQLDEAERSVVRRAKNASVPSSSRSRRNTKAYRGATALEALVAHWELAGDEGRARFDAVLGPPLERSIQAAVELRGRAIVRG